VKRVTRQVTPRFRRDRDAWEVDYRDLHGKRHRPLFLDEEKAQEFAADLIKKLKSSVFVDTTTMTLGQAFNRYFMAKARKPSLFQDRLYAKGLLAAFGKDTLLRQITANRIAAYREARLTQDHRYEKGRKLAAATINRPLSILRALLRMAHDEWGVLTSVPKIRLEKEPQGRLRWLEPDEEARLMAACAKLSNSDLTGIVTVALETGLRKGELRTLTWDRVDLSRGVIRLELTKSGKRREVPMRQVVYDILAQRPGPREGRVFPGRNLRASFVNAVTEAKIDDFHFHDTRHHFASWFMMRGGQLLALKEILGHRSLKMTERYAHLAPEHLRSEITKTERKEKPGTTGTRKVEPAGLSAEDQREVLMSSMLE